MGQREQGRAGGNLTVEQRARGGRVWIAALTTGDGRRTRTLLGPAWVKDSGRKTARGAIVWRANDGSAPHCALTPKAAQDALEELLEAERGKALRRPLQAGKTIGEAGEAFVRHAASVGGKRGEVSPSTLRGYRSILGVLAADFPPDLALVKITQRQLEEYQERPAHRPASRSPGAAAPRHRPPPDDRVADDPQARRRPRVAR